MKKIIFAAAAIVAAMFVSCGNKGNITMGSLSDFDSLSYAIGANFGYGIGYEMGDIPFDDKAFDAGLKDGALEKGKKTHDEYVEVLRDYFMNKRSERASLVAEKHAAEDSVRMAAGDSTKLERPADASMFENEQERYDISYAFGYDVGTTMRNTEWPLQIVWVMEGVNDVKAGKSKMDEAQVQGYLQHYMMVVIPEQNAKASGEWLAKMEKSGAQKTESGIVYKIEKKGDETLMAKDNRDQVKVHYTGRTRNGKVFDTSLWANRPEQVQKVIKERDPDNFGKDMPADFPLNQVIPGWTEGMKLIGKGGKITLWIPSELAYGQYGQPRAGIGPNEALEFEIELLDVTPYVEPAAQPDSLSTEAAAVIPAVE